MTGKTVEVAADLVVLATAIVPSPWIKDLAAKLRATVDRHGFLTEAHIKLYPVESSTKGIYLAGCGQSPKDISDTVSRPLPPPVKFRHCFQRINFFKTLNRLCR